MTATFNDQFLPHTVSNTYYSTATEAFGIFLISFDDRLIDIEGYSMNSVTTNSSMKDPMPHKIGVVRTGDWTEHMVLYGHRDLEGSSGMFIT